MKYLEYLRLSAFPYRAASIALAIAAFAVMTNASAEGFDTLSHPEKMADQAIIVAGNIGKRQRMTDYSKSNSILISQQNVIYEIGQYCFSLNSLDDISGKAGMLMVDRFSNPSIALISSLVSIKISVEVTLFDCISLMMQEQKQISSQADRQLETFKTQLETLKTQRELLDKMQKNQRQLTKPKP